MILKSSRNLCLKLYGKVQFIVTQNIDGLHLRSGVPRRNIAELHGNMFTAQCDKCKRMFVRGSPAPTVGQKYVGEDCPAVSKIIPKYKIKLIIFHILRFAVMEGGAEDDCWTSFWTGSTSCPTLISASATPTGELLLLSVWEVFTCYLFSPLAASWPTSVL